MTSSPFSIRLDAEIKARLEKQAKREDRSAGYIVQKAIARYLDAKAYFYEEMAKAEAELEKGEFISEEAMMKWFESLGTKNELPPPEPERARRRKAAA